MSTQKQEIIYYLEMHDPNALRPRRCKDNTFSVMELSAVDPTVNQRFYLAVGSSYDWTERAQWTLETWSDYILKDKIHTFVARSGSTELGYFELMPDGADVEIMYFGLLPTAVGKGYGACLLTRAVEEAWALVAGMEDARVWVHTCNFDHPNALGNYQRIGFDLYNTEYVEGGAP